jgi:ABC-2 type transport system permease protein
VGDIPSANGAAVSVFAHLRLDPLARGALSPGVTWGTWHVPTLLELGIAAAVGLALLSVGAAQLRRVE